MTYRTRASEDLVDTLQCRIARLEHNLTTEQTPMQHAVDTAWLDATKLALHDFYLAADKIEAEAALVPEHEESVVSVAERIVEEHWPMAGDFRDFPSAA